MKTLQQRLWETGFGGEICDTVPPILRTVQEWLEEKRDKIPFKAHYHTNNSEDMTQLGKMQLFKELIDELTISGRTST